MDFTKKDSLALKGIAILMMYVHHFYLSPERWAGYTVDFFPLTESMTVYLAEFLKTCVCVFVFITGYGMTQSLKQKHPNLRPSSTDMLSYTRHRLVSLLSNFIFVYLLVILVSFPTGRFFEIYGRSGSSILYVLVDMFGLAKLFKTPSYVGTWWYMSLAIVLVVLFPLFVKLYREYRWAFLFAVMLLPRFLNLRVVNTNLLHYTLAMALGMYCAESDLFSRWKNFEETRLRKIPKILLFLFHLLLLAALVVFRQSDAGQGLLEVFDGIIPVYIAYFGRLYLFRLRGLCQVLMFLGKHSMNMFLTHTLIRTTFFQDFSYSFGNAWLNVLVLLVITVLLSMVIEALKKLVHFSDFVHFLTAKI
ncbi:MAG TPA: acyltransferase [Candidatus Anaerobutyricum avicola]|nr:acyltransferase [Candidatus Anaerobutyricum avicola]